MSSDPGFKEKFNFRGQIKGGQDFYMLAVLKEEYLQGEGNFISENAPNFEHLGTESDKYFFLCLNHYFDTTVSDTGPYPSYDRLYWSSDPDDFQYNNSQGYMNEGVARINVGSANRTLRYRSSYDGYSTSNKHNTTYYNTGPDLDRLTRQNQGMPVTFSRKEPEGGEVYALKDNSLFYSVPYSVVNTNTLYSANAGTVLNNIEWSFRKCSSTTTTPDGVSGQGVGILEETGTNSDKIINFVRLDTLSNLEGTNTSFFNYGTAEWYQQDTTMGSSFYENGTCFILADTGNTIIENTYLGNSIIELSTGTSSTVINYSKRYSDNGTSVIFTPSNPQNSRGLLGNDFDIDNGSGVSILVNQRNTDSCFANLSTNSSFDTWFDIYLIPVEENAYLPGGFHTLDNVVFTNSCSRFLNGNPITPLTGLDQLSFYSYNTIEPFTLDQIRAGGVNPNLYYTCGSNDGYNHDKENDYQKIYNLLFFFLIGSLNTDYWQVTAGTPPAMPTTSGIQNYPNIASEPILQNGSYTGKFTFYMWDTYAESSAGYMFNYCRGTNVCGKCSGNNKEAENKCFADSLTREYAAKSNTPSGKILNPLAGSERPTGTHSNPGKHSDTLVIVIVSVLVVVLCISVGAVMYVKRKKWRENKV